MKNLIESIKKINIIIWLLIALIILFLLFLFFGVKIYKSGSASGFNQGKAQGLQIGMEIAKTEDKQVIENSNIGEIDKISVYQLNCRVQSLSSSTGQIIVMANNLNRNPLSDPTPNVRNVMIGSSTKIIYKIRKPDNIYSNEKIEYEKAKLTNKNAARPQPYTETLTSLDSIKNGQQLKVTADTDIRYLRIFEAKEVYIIGG